jgi:NADP-dependent 3-hydroxy acid dehydrogenase YdfG
MSSVSRRLQDRVAVVTGASSGLGQAIARALAKEGACVVGVARRFPERRLAEPLVAGHVVEVRLDVTDEAAVEACFTAIGGVDLLVNNAGLAVYEPILTAKVADLRAMLEVHVVGSFLCTRAALPSMQARGGGHVVNVSSIAAFRTFTSCAGYTAAKEGQRGLTRVLCEEARALNVRVTGLYPGATDTPIWDARPDFDRSTMMRPERVAELVVEIVTRPDLNVEELQVMPPRGAL